MKQTKKYLQQYRIATLELESLAEEKERLMSNLYSITSDPSNDGGAGSKDKLGDGVAQLVDLNKQIDEDIKHYIQVRDDVRGVVREVMHRNIVLGQCLHYRYIMFDTPEQSAWNMGYAASHERRIHAKALEEAQKVIDKKMSANERSKPVIV